MDKIRLGRTELLVSRSSFGAIPIQRISFDEAKKLLLKAYDNGINFYDTARGYSDSEEKLGYAFSGIRSKIIIATKSPAINAETVLNNLETSLGCLKTDYIDIFQLHNPETVPGTGPQEEIYSALLEAKRKGMIRFIGFTNHKVSAAQTAINSGLYDTLQFPLNYLSSENELALVKACKEKDLGFIAMKGLSGGLISNVPATFTFLRQLETVVPIWGIQHEWELDEFISLEKNPPQWNEEMKQAVEKDKKELAGSFCRACGYCQPCPSGIPISTAARITFMMKRMPYEVFITDEWKERMELITKCTECGQCKKRCPYGLDIPSVLRQMLSEYREFVKENSYAYRDTEKL